MAVTVVIETDGYTRNDEKSPCSSNFEKRHAGPRPVLSPPVTLMVLFLHELTTATEPATQRTSLTHLIAAIRQVQRQPGGFPLTPSPAVRAHASLPRSLSSVPAVASKKPRTSYTHRFSGNASIDFRHLLVTIKASVEALFRFRRFRCFRLALCAATTELSLVAVYDDTYHSRGIRRTRFSRALSFRPMVSSVLYWQG